MINSTFDPNTGYANAVHAEQLLGNAVLITQEGYGHTTSQNPSACVNKAITDYLTELITPPRARSASPISSPSIRISLADRPDIRIGRSSASDEDREPQTAIAHRAKEERTLAVDRPASLEAEWPR